MITYKWWHSLLDLRRKDKPWHDKDISEELAELDEATGFLHRWSELADVVYTVTRARWDGYDFTWPLKKQHFLIGSIYMFPKFTLRWLFFYRAGKKAGALHKVTEVRNPEKIEKLHHIAERNSLDPDKFVAICRRQRRHWPLLK